MPRKKSEEVRKVERGLGLALKQRDAAGAAEVDRSIRFGVDYSEWDVARARLKAVIDFHRRRCGLPV